MKTNIEIEKSNISFMNRMKYYILLYIGLISVFGLIDIVSSDKKSDFTFMAITSIVFGLLIGYKLYQQRNFLILIKSDSKTIEAHYLNFSSKQIIITKIEEIEIKLKNTSSRAGFNCELFIEIENKNFTINNDFEWGFDEIQELFQFIKFYKNESLTEKEKHTISRIENKLKQNPF
jgi:hypothetical protein